MFHKTCFHLKLTWSLLSCTLYLTDSAQAPWSDRLTVGNLWSSTQNSPGKSLGPKWDTYVTYWVDWHCPHIGVCALNGYRTYFLLTDTEGQARYSSFGSEKSPGVERDARSRQVITTPSKAD